jgi:hypothetical protein
MGCKPIALSLRWFESNPAHWLALRASHFSLSEHPLHQDDVEPAVELAAYLAFAADLLEAAGGVQGDRGGVLADDAADHRMEAVVTSQLHEIAEQESSDALTPEVAPDVHGVFDGGRVRGPRPVGRQRCEAADLIVVVDGDDRGVAARMLVDPGDLLGEGAGNEIEGHRRLEHLDVVDRAQRIGVAPSDQAGSVREGRRHGG